MTKTELFIKLAQPNESGVSRWVDITEFTGEYACLTFGNGASWARKESILAKKYNIEFDKDIVTQKYIFEFSVFNKFIHCFFHFAFNTKNALLA